MKLKCIENDKKIGKLQTNLKKTSFVQSIQLTYS